MAPIRCLDCGTPSPRTRCPACQRNRDRSRNASRPHYAGPWQSIRTAARRAHPLCAACGTTTDLTVDHVDPRRTDTGLLVLCRRCNAAKSSRRLDLWLATLDHPLEPFTYGHLEHHDGTSYPLLSLRPARPA